VAQTRVFGPQQIVEVAAGTEFLMAPGASFVFLGKVVIAGAKDRPVTFRPAEGKPWGGIALQGRATAGSTLDQVRVVGGTRPDWGLIPFPATLNVHDTRDIAVRNILLEKPEKPFEAFHATYVDDLRIEDTEVADAPADAFDLEFVKGSMRNIRVRGAGDDGVDLMGSAIVIHDSVILGCANNAVSAGEETRVEIHGALLAASQVGVLAKNASTVLLSGSLLFRNGIGARVYKREVRFAGESVVQADSLFVVGCLESTKRDDDSSEAFRVGRIHERLPEDGSLDHLAADVLGLGGWNEIDAWLERARVKR
jgi:hypothetical protein